MAKNKREETPHPPIDAAQLTETLGLTIKHDDSNKLATFLCMLSAYTEDDQLNVSFNAPSSTGKTFIPTQVAGLFPAEDVREFAHVTPTAFFYEADNFDKESNRYIVDLSRKIIVFLDQPHNNLLANLRPLLSHDKKEIILKMTDKDQKAGTRTKTVLVRGFPAVVFCTAGLRIDEQEATRFLLLSPETSQEKILDGISATISRAANPDRHARWLAADPERARLKERIRAIRDERIEEICITDEEQVRSRFMRGKDMVRPSHLRDIKRLISIIKCFALLNLWHREQEGKVVTASSEDIDAGFDLWGRISRSQEMNLPPYVYDLYETVIEKLWKAQLATNPSSEPSLTRQQILTAHYQITGRPLDGDMFRGQILSSLKAAGLVREERDLLDKRHRLILPGALSKGVGINSAATGGVNPQGDPL